jgi:uncharacterized phage-associated protein
MPLDFQPKIDKIVELLLYLAHKRPNADKYQAVKFFYLADREHLNRYGRPITHERYVALRYGPVASKAMDLLEEDKWVMREAQIDALPFRTGLVEVNGKLITYIREPLRDVNFDLFSKSDIRVFDEIIDRFGDKTFDQLFRLTHNHAAYKLAWSRRGSTEAFPMNYEDMIESTEKRAAIMEDIAPVAANME